MSRRAALAGLVLLAALPASAHRLKVFATAEGRKISGYAYFPGGGRAVRVPVLATGPGGEELGRTTTDEKGCFSLEAKWRCDHTLVVETPDGHKATYRVEAAELPSDLPPLGGAGRQGAPRPQGHGTGEKGQPQVAAGPVKSGQVLEDAVARAVARELRPLREQLERYEAKRRLHDIIGGIGYILGISGVAFYLLARRRGGSSA